MSYIPARGDIVHLDFDPAAGKEMAGKHFALVMSARAFNALGLAMVCPISQGHAQLARSRGFLVSLMGTGTVTQGNVHCHQLKSLDLRTRNVKHRESVPAMLVDEVAAVLEAILFDN